MLYEFQNYNKHGNIRTRIIPWPNVKAFGINPKGLGSYIGVKVFKYEQKHEILPPGLINAGGKKYIVPGCQEVLPETELNDIKWVKPKPKVVVKQEPIVVTSVSSSSNKTYTTTYYPDSGKFWCDCPGMWRSGGNCKHVKSLREKVK